MTISPFYRKRFPAIGLLLLLGASPTCFAQGTGRVVPSDPRPAREWSPPTPPPSFSNEPQPDLPKAQPIRPLKPKRDGIQVRRFGQAPPMGLPPPEEPPKAGTSVVREEPPAEISGEWDHLTSRTMRPVVLPVTQRLAVTGDGVALREGPGPDFPRIAGLGKGETLAKLDTDDDWHRVEISSGTKGWISSKYAEELIQFPAIVTGERVHLRERPSIDGLSLGTLYQGAILLASAPRDGWVEVRTPNIARGYVSELFVEPLPKNLAPNYPLKPHPSSATLVASLAPLIENATGPSDYALAIWGDEWVKGGKASLIHFAREIERDDTGRPISPRFSQGTYFQKTVLKEDFQRAFGAFLRIPEGTRAITVAYLRGQKNDSLWMFPFSFQGEGAFAVACQEGPHTGTYLLLKEKDLD